MRFPVILAALALTGCGGDTTRSSFAGAVDTVPVQTIDAADLAGLMARGRVLLVDVRSPAEFAGGHIAGAINMPVEWFDASAVPVISGRQTVLYCHSGKRSRRAGGLLAARTTTAIHLDGGIVAWQAAGLPVERPARVR